MSECTKGELKWERHGNRCNLYMDGAWIGELYVGYGMKSIEEMEANADELVRRWNAFEDGGIVDELRTTLENALTTLVIIAMPRLDDNVATDTELLKILGDSFKAALAKS